MRMPDQIASAQGSWKGSSRLHLSWLPPEERITESESTLKVDLGAQGEFATITYTWQYEGQQHDGTILACTDQKQGTIEYAWLDSWHQAGSVLKLVGPIQEGAPLKAHGIYMHEPEVWGWTIAFSLKDEVLTLAMENVDPSGLAEWAVEGHYTRS